MKPTPKSRRPEHWPDQIMAVLRAATRDEVLVPFETSERITVFKGLLRDIRRSLREHGHPDFPSIAKLSIKTYTTEEMRNARPKYSADAKLYPFTAIISSALGYASNLSEALVVTPTPETQTPPPVEPHIAEIDAELLDLVRNLPDNDENSIAELFTSNFRASNPGDRDS